MTLSIQNLPVELNVLFFSELESADLLNSMKVCKAWKQIIEGHFFLSGIKYDASSDLVINKPNVILIDKDFSVSGTLLIRVRLIFSKPGISLTATSVTFVAKRINFLGPINAKRFDSYNDESFVKGPFPGGSSYRLKDYSPKSDGKSSLVSYQHKSKNGRT